MKRTLIALAVLPVLAACDGPKWYDSEVEVKRVDVVRRDKDGNPLTADLEVSYVNCPGEQIETIRGGAEFAKCITQHKAGEKVKVKLLHHPTPEGYYDWDIHEVAGCSRPPDAEDEASFDMVRECEDLLVNGVAVGFHCNLLPQKKLLAKCPWFRKH